MVKAEVFLVNSANISSGTHSTSIAHAPILSSSFISLISLTASADVFPKGFMDTNLADGSKLGDHPAVIKAFAALAGKMGEDNIIQSSGPAMMTPKQLDKEILALQAPGSAYWDSKHPGHDAAVEEVKNLFEQKHGEE